MREAYAYSPVAMVSKSTLSKYFAIFLMIPLACLRLLDCFGVLVTSHTAGWWLLRTDEISCSNGQRHLSVRNVERFQVLHARSSVYKRYLYVRYRYMYNLICLITIFHFVFLIRLPVSGSWYLYSSLYAQNLLLIQLMYSLHFSSRRLSCSSNMGWKLLSLGTCS